MLHYLFSNLTSHEYTIFISPTVNIGLKINLRLFFLKGDWRGRKANMQKKVTNFKFILTSQIQKANPTIKKDIQV